MENSRNPIAVKSALRDYINQIWLLKKYSIAAMVLPGLGNILVMYVPSLIVASIVANYSTSSSVEELVPELLLLAIVWSIGELTWRIANHLLNITVPKGMYNLYTNGLENLLKKDMGFFHNNFAGSLTKKLVSYGKSFDLFISVITFSVTANAIPILFAGVILWMFSPWLVFVLIGLMGITIAILIPLVRRRQKLVAIRETASNTMAGHIADIIGNIDAVQAFANEEQEKHYHRKYVKDYVTKSRKSWDYGNLRIDLAISPFYILINVVGLIVAIIIGDNQQNTAAIFVTFTYYIYATRVLWEFNSIYRNLESSITEAAQFTELLIDKPDTKNIDAPAKIGIKEGEIVFDNVAFRYKDGKENIFDGLTLKIKPGEKVAFVGHSGSGKTTITKLLLRTKEINKGKILIDGQDISKYTLNSLRKSIAYVPQEPAMFHRTIFDNIAYGKLDATEEEVITAALQANAHEFIETLPNGYETYVGERGVKLSGGQRQRIAIARAMIKDAPILVLDEATSALDSISEGLIQEGLWELMEGRTAIVIAHRLSTIQKMDRIIVIDKGKIVEQGSHQELLKKKGEYAKLWKHQSGGFIKD